VLRQSYNVDFGYSISLFEVIGVVAAYLFRPVTSVDRALCTVQEVKVPRLHDNGTGWYYGCQPHAPATFYPQEMLLLEAESTPGP